MDFMGISGFSHPEGDDLADCEPQSVNIFLPFVYLRR
jgi:hypothetical protein